MLYQKKKKKSDSLFHALSLTFKFNNLLLTEVSQHEPVWDHTHKDSVVGH